MIIKVKCADCGMDLGGFVLKGKEHTVEIHACKHGEKDKSFLMLELGRKVRIRATGIEGIIVGTHWRSSPARNQYQVRYYDTAKRLTTQWVADDEIEAVAEKWGLK